MLPSADDRAAIAQLKARYFRFLDNKQWDQLRRVFAEDATFEGFWTEVHGPNDFVEKLQLHLGPNVVSVHQGFMPEFAAVDAGIVRGIWAMSDYVAWPRDEREYRGVRLAGQWGFLGYGHYEEEYRCVEGRWLIGHMRLTRLRVDPLVGEVPPQPEYGLLRLSADWLEAGARVDAQPT